MANLATKAIDTHGEYVKLDTALSITLTAGKTYTFQSLYGEFYIRRGTVGKGFKIVNLMIGSFKAVSGVDIYVKTGVNAVTINIDEEDEESEE